MGRESTGRGGCGTGETRKRGVWHGRDQEEGCVARERREEGVRVEGIRTLPMVT